ncbi:MAG: AAA family ATPase, partial [Anaerovorax sp.]
MAGILDLKPNPVNIVGNPQRINFSSDDFKILRERDTCYVDKSKLIEDILKYDDGKMMLFTRPRRFGKSLNLSMIRYFFDMKEDSRGLFQDLYLEKSPLFEENLNQYPVVYLNFKDSNTVKAENTSKAIAGILKNMVEDLILKYDLEKELRNLELTYDDGSIMAGSFKQITKVLKEKTGREVVVLVDEYDNLINKAYGNEDFIEICTIIKDIFGALFKSNEYLKLGILTGVSRIGRELSFSDMNNLIVYGLTHVFYYEYYGFTEEEVKALLKLHKIALTPEFYKMYNGYRLNNSQNMFNTASILKFLDNYLDQGRLDLNSYWVNAATNAILKDNIQGMNSRFKDNLLSMIDGETIDESLVASIDYESLDKPENLFTLLIDTGYLCPIQQLSGDIYELKIPNKEVLYGYKDMVESMVGVSGQKVASICKSLVEEKIRKFEEQLQEVLLTVSSFHDFSEKENSYHNF